MTNQPPERYLKTREVTDLLGVTDRTLRRWRQKGVLRASKIGGVVRYGMTDLERAMGTEPEAISAIEISDLDELR